MPKRPRAPAQAGERYSVCGAKASALNHCAQALGVGSRSRSAATPAGGRRRARRPHVLAASAAFTSARGMSIRRDGASVDTLPLAGSRGAISSLAKCLADRWNEGPAPAEAKEAAPAVDDSI